MVKEIDFSKVPTPCYLLDERLLIKNLSTLRGLTERTGCRILLAQKSFAMFYEYPLIKKYLHGTTASGLFEAKLGYEEMGGEVHIFSPAYLDHEFDEILQICDHIVFNSFAQWRRFKDRVKQGPRPISCGLRVNPEYSEQEHGIYDPAAPGSRLGVTLANFEPELLEGIEGLHFHTLCEQNSDVLARTLKVFDEKFGTFMKGMKWLNLGGGHHITRPDYDLATLEKFLHFAREKYGVQVYLEPGEAVVLNCGYLVARVLDFVHNGLDIAILDTSAACHMPDVLEMPYRPQIIGSGLPGDFPYTYRLGGPTCLAGDIIGDYSFPQPLKAGDPLVFCDMAHYTMVKNNTFNGIKLPSIGVFNDRDGLKIIKEFGYYDFKNRLS
ncbi:carboxynorspermidine decarboxylase [Dehalobacterium formicoaceticum]|uniref:Carboxynorspermidine decarboxylase n=1 Tax=Dehalobacterium formicoaceticum TaxID=51515 RepID=A0ABT1Y7A2_9FIRM|nr:carboxynorspermidine decarboxylase [Dehalobacterium formicoaceticum]MCR6546765.1 carboxynorspermidine decarboxylase [Dehalobacterium formicoaceticum]